MSLSIIRGKRIACGIYKLLIPFMHFIIHVDRIIVIFNHDIDHLWTHNYNIINNNNYTFNNSDEIHDIYYKILEDEVTSETLYYIATKESKQKIYFYPKLSINNN